MEHKLYFSAKEFKSTEDLAHSYSDEEKFFLNGLCVLEKKYNVTIPSASDYVDNTMSPNINCYLEMNLKTTLNQDQVLLSVDFKMSEFRGYSDYNLKISILNKYLHQVVLCNRLGNAIKKNVNLEKVAVDNFEELYVNESNRFKIIFELVAWRTVHTSRNLSTHKRNYNNREDFGETDEQANDLLSLLSSGDFSDLMIVIGEQRIKAHKNILAAQSPIFFEMFKKSKESEAKILEIELKDVSYEVFQTLLYWMYSGQIKNLGEEVSLEFLKLASKFEVKKVISAYEKIITNYLNLENCIKYLSFADANNLENLKLFATKFIIRNFDEFDAKQLEKLNSSLLATVVIESRKEKKYFC